MVQFKELQVELGEMSELKDSLLRELKDMEKRVKLAEADNDTLRSQMQASDKARKAVSIFKKHVFNPLASVMGHQ